MNFTNKSKVLKARVALLTVGYTFKELNKMSDSDVLSLAILSLKKGMLSN